MNKLLIGAGAAALAVAIAPSFAQSAPPAGVAPGVAPGTGPAPQVHMRVMSDRVMTRGEVTTHVGKLFAKLDGNRDGFVTRQEVDAIHQKFANMHSDVGKRLADHGVMMGDRGAIFDKLDTNRDGSISRQEFTAQNRIEERRVIVMRDGDKAGARGGRGMRMHMGMGMGMGFGGRMFEMADGNKDGRVSLAEAQATALAHFDRADVNHDGRITPDERQQIRQQRRTERRSS